MTVQIDSPTSVRISWLPISPSGWNGILISYIVQYERQGQAGALNTPVESYVTSTASIPSLPQHPLANTPDPRLATLPLALESLLLEGLEENYVYEFTVYCINSAGSSEMSNSVAITMPSSGNKLLLLHNIIYTYTVIDDNEKRLLLYYKLYSTQWSSIEYHSYCSVFIFYPDFMAASSNSATEWNHLKLRC